MGRVQSAAARMHVTRRALAMLLVAGCGLEKPILISDAPPPPADTAPDALSCASDMFEPNDARTEAPQLHKGGETTQTVSAVVCPGTDKDYFYVDVQVDNTLELLVDRPTGDTGLQASIQNASGSAVASASPVFGMPTRLRAQVVNLPDGIYYMLVYSNESQGSRAYTLTLNASP